MVDILGTPQYSIDALGEFLRDSCFKEKTGCYSCFDLRDDFVEFPSETIPLFVRTILAGCYAEAEKHRMNFWHSYTRGISVYWYWDGDGTLCFLLPDGTYIYNTDCKKHYDWSTDTEWVTEVMNYPNYYEVANE